MAHCGGENEDKSYPDSHAQRRFPHVRPHFWGRTGKVAINCPKYAIPLIRKERNSLASEAFLRETRSVKKWLGRGAYKWVGLEKDTQSEPEAIMIAILYGHTHHHFPGIISTVANISMMEKRLPKNLE
ncbi:hypothetical protein CDAR_375581 [Caerostris darwini]|uniref:Uncharacterized protein n=1 Tax=Caerostris darwini TaxID=1538125 RepID=A0AAV4S571_9ARAC|nr:hypothetical protein CDAR_375581 [Caerostris darwini]